MRYMTARIVLALAAFACGGLAAAASAKLQPITTSEAAVAVRVTPRVVDGPVWEFAVAFDTHSQELKDDLMKSASLVAADGRQVPPMEWKGAPPGGHHRSGLLRFAAIDPAPATIVLRISRDGEAKPRIYSWARP